MTMRHLTNILRLGIKELYSLRQDTVLLMLIGPTNCTKPE